MNVWMQQELHLHFMGITFYANGQTIFGVDMAGMRINVINHVANVVELTNVSTVKD